MQILNLNVATAQKEGSDQGPCLTNIDSDSDD